MTDHTDDTAPDAARAGAFAAAAAWSAQMQQWGIPQHILDQAPESPWFHDPNRFAVDDTLDRHHTSVRWAREVLPPIGGTVLDIGCGGGRSAISLVPPATEVIGVDTSGAMLDQFIDAAAAAGVARRTVHGAWPDVAPNTPIADVVVCHHVVFNVVDLAPFVMALTAHARLAVVIEMPTAHPMSAWSPAWKHFWGLERPPGPTLPDFLAVLAELGIAPEHTVSPRAALSNVGADPKSLVPSTRRRLCLPASRDGEIAEYLAQHPPPFVANVATVRWPGAAEAA